MFHGQRRTVFFICVKVLNLHLVTFFLNENSIQVKAGVTAAEGSHHVQLEWVVLRIYLLGSRISSE